MCPELDASKESLCQVAIAFRDGVAPRLIMTLKTPVSIIGL